jgi:hypothetical protein
LNLRPSGYEPDELPGCSTPRWWVSWWVWGGWVGGPGGDLLSRGLSRSTMGAGGFHGRVRDGIGCGLPAKATRSSSPSRMGERGFGVCAEPSTDGGSGDDFYAWGVGSRRLSFGQLTTANRRLVARAVRAIRTGQLSALPRVHLRPIDVMVYHGPLGRPGLEEGFPLRCFQRLSRPHIATRRCRWRDNRCTRGASIPVLSYWGQRLASLLHPRQIGTELSHDVLNPAHVPL